MCCEEGIEEACEKGYVYETPDCFKTVDGVKDGDALAKTDECCIEGWRIDNENLKASCNISSFVYTFELADEVCLLDTTTILPTTNTQITTTVSNEDCCNNSSGPSDPLDKSCEFVVRNFAVVTEGKTWAEAEDDCIKTHGGHLISMHSVVENDEAASQYKLNGGVEGQFWIGFKEFTLFGWGWSDGDRTEYANW